MTTSLPKLLVATSDAAADWPPHLTVAELLGSLPMGGMVANTPVHAFATTPDRLRLREDIRAPVQRQDIDLGGLLAFRVNPVLDARECQALIDAAEHFGFREEAPGIATPPGMRMNKTVHWVADAALLGPIFRRIEGHLPPAVDGLRLLPGLSHRINVYRYDDGDVFNTHIDGDWPGYGLSADRQRMLEWPDGRSCLSMLLYLNGVEDGVQGGATRLLRSDGTALDVAPQKGSALFFRHGFVPESVRHVGCQVSGTVPKYLARINVMYQRPTEAVGASGRL
jgi:hypothetical protein